MKLSKKVVAEVEKLILALREQKNLTAQQFFIEARKTPWGKKVPSMALVECYSESLGRLTVRGQLPYDEALKAIKA